MSVSGSQFAAMDAPSSPADDAKREKEIREAFQPILAEHRTWANDPDLKLYPPGLVLHLVQVFLSCLCGWAIP
jgi:hypothetical protein